MNDQFETATEAVQTEYRIQLDGVATIVVFSLATYGAQDLARKAYAKTKQIRSDRKAKKALKADTPQ